MVDAIGSTFRETVDEGYERLHRTWPALLATGFVGGIDVSVGVLGLLLVQQRTGSEVLAALTFTFGFIALTMASSELFTENFLVPISAVLAEKGTPAEVLRLWSGTLATNLVGGMVFVGLIVTAFPEVGDTAVSIGATYIERGIGLQAFASAVLAGAVITLMTWMQHGSDALGPRLVAAVAAGFLLAFAHLSHVIVASLEVFAGILSGAGYGYGDWFGQFLLWVVGNAVGGLGLVTVLRLVQVGRRRVTEEQQRDVEPTTTEKHERPAGPDHGHGSRPRDTTRSRPR